MIRDLKVDRPVQIDAFISPTVPEDYVQTRLNLLSALRELQALGGGKLQVQIHDTDRYSAEAALGREALRHRAPPSHHARPRRRSPKTTSSCTWS